MTASTADAMIPFERVPPRFDGADDLLRADALLPELREDDLLLPALLEDDLLAPALLEVDLVLPAPLEDDLLPPVLPEERLAVPELLEAEPDLPADREVDVEDLPPDFEAGFAERDAVPLLVDDVFDFIEPLELPVDREAVDFFAVEPFDDLEVDRDEVDLLVDVLLDFAPDEPDFDPPDLDADDFEDPDREAEEVFVVAMIFLRVIELSFENVRSKNQQTMCLGPKGEICVTWKTILVSNPCASTISPSQILRRAAHVT